MKEFAKCSLHRKFDQDLQVKENYLCEERIYVDQYEDHKEIFFETLNLRICRKNRSKDNTKTM